MKKHRTIIALALILALTLSMAGVAIPDAEAASSSEIREQLEELEAEQEDYQAQIDALEQQIAENLSSMQEIVEQKNLIDQQVALLNGQIANVNERLAAYAVLIADKQEELEAAQARLEELNQKNRERIRAMEENGTLSYWSVLFKANSFADLLDRLNMIEEIAAADQARLRLLSEAAQRVADAQAELEAERDGLQDVRNELESTQVELDQKRAEADILLDQLRAQGEEFDLYMEEAEQRQSDVMLRIAQKEDELDEAEYQEWLATYVPPETSSGGGGYFTSATPNPGGWITPVPWYIITSPFGPRLHPIYGDYRMHYGVDMACDEGTPIYATRGGKVIVAEYDSSCGNYVTIDHGDGFRSIYMHMTYFVVSYGEYVAAGQVIGYVGSTGDSTGPHLHFGISYNGTYVNPMEYVS